MSEYYDDDFVEEREGNSGFHLFPSFVTVLFLRILQVVAEAVECGLLDVFYVLIRVSEIGFSCESSFLSGDLDLNRKVPDTFFETWKEFVSCQVTSSIGCFHSKKCLTADSSTVYSVLVSSETSAASLGNTYKAEDIDV
ncbi:unnamed protein product [Sphenostylis stenocarpa]|uniref:Uncharacterized protein n=1 Tax=Sphenostylis stenocarpa TaxID=92480 RepID=A0AA86S7J6_9FABA|nr:unnamed protein product [Sphenostylis stenocarpa]